MFNLQPSGWGHISEYFLYSQNEPRTKTSPVQGGDAVRLQTGGKPANNNNTDIPNKPLLVSLKNTFS